MDKGSHGERLTDLESMTLWVSIGATPLHFVTSLANGALAAGAQQGRIFGSTTRIFATVLNFTTLGFDGVMLSFGIANLIEKKKKDQLTSLDILQFSMSVFFFTNTVIQPKTAGQIIKTAQEQHIQNYANNLNDQQAQEVFNNFVERNRGEHVMHDNSKIIRTINRIENPNDFFKHFDSQTSIDIGGRKGRTIIVTDANGHQNRINPNRYEPTYFQLK